MSERVIVTAGVALYEREILEQHWREDKFGELTDEKLRLLAENVNALNDGTLYDDIEHVLNVWEECGVQ